MTHCIKTKCICGSVNVRELDCNVVGIDTAEFILQCGDCGVRLVWHLTLIDFDDSNHKIPVTKKSYKNKTEVINK